MKMPFSQSEEAKFNMAPMIDMVFLLLIFFMLASRLSVAQKMEMEIPVASKAVVPRERPDRFVVNIMPDGGIFVGPRPVTIAELREEARAYQTVDPAAKVYLRGDQNAEFKQVQKVMAVMSELGINDFIFGAHVPEG